MDIDLRVYMCVKQHIVGNESSCFFQNHLQIVDEYMCVYLHTRTCPTVDGQRSKEQLIPLDFYA